MRLYCDKHNLHWSVWSGYYYNEAYRKNCSFCEKEKTWKKKGRTILYCKEHDNRPYLISCSACTQGPRYRWKPKISGTINEKQVKFDEAYKENQKHVNESCSSCDKSISFDEWFCYCALCTDCYQKIPEEELKAE
jgi:hypothetical protein